MITLSQISVLKRSFGIATAQLAGQLRELGSSQFSDVEALIRFHETLLFFRAYPSSADVLKQVEQMLKTFEPRVSRLRDGGADVSSLEDPEVSGIAGGSVTSNFSYPVVRWLVAKYPRETSIDWDWFDEEDRFGATMPRFLPLLTDDAMVEAHVPYREWLRAARGRSHELVWLIERFESLRISDNAKAELYDSLKLRISWQFDFRSSRTGMKLPVGKVFFHDQQLIQRHEISLITELSSSPIPVQRVSKVEGENILDLARETSAVRYRELHGFTYGDAGRVSRADLGRGTQAYVMGVPPEHRLPLRAYHAALIFKNGVPVAYFEGLSFFERMESGFNLYYTFRDGETAWLYARILRLMRQMLGVTVFSIDPYQIGHENKEGIESGAFWFYRKLGFRPVRPSLMKLAMAEEQKMAQSRRHRSSPHTLRKLAAGHLLFETSGASQSRTHEWDRFEIRKIGLAVQRRMAREFGGDAEKIRADSAQFVRRTLALGKPKRGETVSGLSNDLALVLAMIPDIVKWTRAEKELATRILFAKTASNEALYLKEMQKHASLRASLIRLGSTGRA
jgi:hypothetical protein